MAVVAKRSKVAAKSSSLDERPATILPWVAFSRWTSAVCNSLTAAS
jgi:hypothetical protein